MRRHSRLVLTLALGGAAACADADITSPGSLAGSGALTQTVSVEVCETITFDDLGLSHGDRVSSVSAFGIPISITVDGTGNHSTDFGALYDTRGEGPDFDLEDELVDDDDTCFLCDDLNLQHVLIIEDSRGFAPEGDSDTGGTITFAGFTPNEFFIDSIYLLDQELSENSIRLEVDDNLLASSSGLGDGSVEQVEVPQTFIQSKAEFILDGSGAIDNIRICRVEEQDVGGEGCTLGFWKNHDGSKKQENEWLATGFSTSQTLEDVFDVPDAYGLDGVTLREALELNGGPDIANKAGLLLKQAVAALLSAAHPEVDYPVTSSDIISDVNAALASGDVDEILDLQKQLDEYNNLGCTVTTND